MRSTFELEKTQFDGININELRTLAENQVLLDNLNYTVKSKLAKLRGITL